MSEEITVSVVIPARNAAAFLAESLASVTSQTSATPCEVIVVDDGSTDGTGDLARAHGARVLQGDGRGLSAARNLGVAASTGELVAFLDADDIWLPEKLERQLDLLASDPSLVLVGSGCTTFGAAPARELRVHHADLISLAPIDFLSSSRLYPTSFVVRGEVARATQFPEGVADSEDMIYLAQVRLAGRIGAVNDPLFLRRMHAGQLTAAAGHWARALHVRLGWLRPNWRRLGVTSLAGAEREVVECLCQSIWNYYWRGEYDEFHKVRREVRAAWPAGISQPRSLTRRVPPDWLVRLKRSAERLIAAR